MLYNFGKLKKKLVSVYLNLLFGAYLKFVLS